MACASEARERLFRRRNRQNCTRIDVQKGTCMRLVPATLGVGARAEATHRSTSMLDPIAWISTDVGSGA